MRAAVVEDCRPDADELVKLLEDLTAPGDTLRIATYTTSEAFLEAAADEHFDIVFLDIQLAGLSGMEAAALLRKADRRILIVFLTNTADYLAAGYRVRAFRYLLKPVRRELLRECLASAREELERTADANILFGSGRQQIAVPANDIVCIRAHGNYVHVHTAEGTLKVREQIGLLADRLPAQFVRVHRCDIVNVLSIARLDTQTITLSDGQQMTVSRKNRQRLREHFAAFH